MVLTETGLAKVFQRVKSFVIAQLNSKASVLHTHTYSEIVDLPNGIAVDSTLDGTSSNAISNSAVSNALDGKSNTGHTHTKSQITDFPSFGNIAGTICEGNDSRLSDARTPTSHTHVKSEITDFPSLATVATSGSYNDLSNKPTIPTVNNATLTIQKNGSNVATFTSNASSNVTANISVPTNTNQLTNGAGFITSEIDSSGTDWVRFKSGLQICWGNMNFGSIEAGGTRDWVLTFPKSFVNSNYISVCGNSSTGSNWMNNCFITYNRKTTAVNVAITNTASASTANTLTSLVTIGKWK